MCAQRDDSRAGDEPQAGGPQAGAAQAGSARGGSARRKPGGRPRWPLYAVAGAVVLAGGGLIGAAVAAPGSSSSAAAAAPDSGETCSVTAVAEQALPSVVTISAAGADGAGTGSGELIRSDGYILTNNHVIAVAAAAGGSVKVLFADGTSEAATIVGRDVLTDLAVLKVADTHGVSPIPLGSSAALQVGQQVIAVGAPLGLSGTVTSGIVSALDRTVEVPAENDASALLVSAVQTDAAINPGNSGGALVNCAGELVGIPSAGASVPSASGESSGGNIGLGFAIPVDAAKVTADEIIATGRATHSYFGLQTVPVPAEAAAEAGLPGALYVAGVAANSPAAKAGLRVGDVITTLAGQPATSNAQVQEATLTKDPGDQVDVGYLRDGKEQQATVTLAAQP